ncbi:MAG: EAL domain-containing protein [Solirubrobacteraceae bacterium]|nr:EAL domain-containing protein [Solirubrobacteraceae bacterium]
MAETSMTALTAVLATTVAVQYLLIGLYIVPRLARLSSEQPGRLITAAMVGAGAFFVGCAITHLGIAAHAIQEGTDDVSTHALIHVLPHVAQVVGGATFILIAARHLDIRFAPKDVAAQLREVEARFRTAFDQAPIGMALVSLSPNSFGRFLQVNPALCAMLGYDEADLRTRTYREITHPADVSPSEEQVTAMVDGVTAGGEIEKRYRHRDGHDVWVNVQASAVRDARGHALYSVSQIRDITEERQYQQRLRHLADHDPLTGLFNRRRFAEELARLVAFSRRYGEPAALLSVDLDRFKYVNDTYGHAVGDELLVQLAAALQCRLRETDIIGRLGGDEFGVLLPRTTTEEAQRTASGLLHEVRSNTSVRAGERVVRLTVSVGITAIDAAESTSAEEILVNADLAMYEAKEQGRDRHATVLPGGQSGVLRERQTWSEHIREALERNRFQLWEQPILDLRTGERSRSEVLLRMEDPDGGAPIPPGSFLSIAERFGQITAVDRWVIGETIAVLADRERRGVAQAIEVNLSGRSITDEALIEFIASEIGNAGVDPTRLVFEITETAAIGNIDRARGFARRLADLGCQFALDDFGSGFGSFYYLKHMPFDCVKIDGDFIKDLPVSQTDRLTVRAIVDIAQGLGKTTIAECVQDEATIDLLREVGVDYAQGFHVGHPTELVR